MYLALIVTRTSFYLFFHLCDKKLTITKTFLLNIRPFLTKTPVLVLIKFLGGVIMGFWSIFLTTLAASMLGLACENTKISNLCLLVVRREKIPFHPNKGHITHSHRLACRQRFYIQSSFYHSWCHVMGSRRRLSMLQ